MKYIKNRLISLVISVCLIASIPVVLPVQAETKISRVEYLTELLTDLEIYTPEDNMSLYNSTITREELASILSVFYGLTEHSIPIETHFADVTSYWASGHIMAMVESGIMSGYSDSLFKPKNEVTIEQAVKIFVCMTGYQPMAEYYGGYPEGYFRAATRFDLLDRMVYADSTKPITRGQFTQLLYNAATMPLMQQVSFGEENDFDRNPDVNLLTEKLNIYKANGIIRANEYVSIDYNNSAENGEIRIDNETFKYAGDTFSLLATDVEAYYRQRRYEEIGTILHVNKVGGTNAEVMVLAKDIQNVTDTTFYYKKNDKVRTISLTDPNLMVVFNGKRLTYYEKEHLFPEQGSVRFVDLDKNGVYEYAFVEYEIDYKIGNISKKDDQYMISDESAKKPLVIESDSNKYFVYVEDRGLEMDIDLLSEGDIISVAADSVDLANHSIKQDSRIYRLKKCYSKLNGVVTAIGDDNQVFVDETEYRVTDDFLRNHTLKLNNQYDFYLNYLGEISYCSSNRTSDDYALLVEVDMARRISQGAYLRIFDSRGQFVELECAKKLKIDGSRYDSYRDISEYLQRSADRFDDYGLDTDPGNYWQLIKYRLDNEGKIKFLDTILANSTIGEDDLNFEVKLEKPYWWSLSGNLGGRYGISNNTVLFDLSQDKTDENNYRVFTRSGLDSNKNDYYLFDGNEMNIVGAGIRIRAASDINSIAVYNLNIIAYTGIKYKISELTGDFEAFMCGTDIVNKGTMEIELEDVSLIKNNGIIPGDFVRWTSSSDGVAKLIEKAVSLDGTGVKANSEYPGGTKGPDGEPGYYTIVRLTCGKALDMDESYIKIRYEGTVESYDEPVTHGEVSAVYIFDSETQEISSGTMSDVRTVAAYGEADADTVCCYYRSGRLTTVVIYR